MNKSLVKTLIGLVSLMSMPAWSAEGESGSSYDQNRNKSESWYWGFNIGGGSVRYRGENQSTANSLKNNADSHATLYFDLGFYWPLMGSERLMLGISAGGIADAYERGAADFTANSSILAASLQYYLTSNIGDGLFLRADGGLGRLTAEAKTGNVSVTDSSEVGFGVRAGIGYSFVLSSETRLPVSLLFQHINTNGDNDSNGGVLTVGLLF